MNGDDARHQTFIQRVRDVAGEHSSGFVFIGEVEDEDGETRTVLTWGGKMNQAIGLAARSVEFMRQQIIQTDFPDEPPSGEDWRAET